MSRIRLDVEMVKRRMVSSRSGARNAIRDGHVVVNGETAERPSQRVAAETHIEIDAAVAGRVGRGSHKLEHALAVFGVEVAGRTGIDVGASTGGFTDVLLQAGARRVVTVDVGHGQLHPRLRTDPRVTVHEGMNIRSADPERLGAPFGVVVADLSFISLTVVAGVLAGLGDATSDWIVLVKPQFEVGPGQVGKDGVVRSGKARGDAVAAVAEAFASVGLQVAGAIAAPIRGTAGNREALLWLHRGDASVAAPDLYKVLADE